VECLYSDLTMYFLATDLFFFFWQEISDVHVYAHVHRICLCWWGVVLRIYLSTGSLEAMLNYGSTCFVLRMSLATGSFEVEAMLNYAESFPCSSKWQNVSLFAILLGWSYVWLQIFELFLVPFSCYYLSFVFSFSVPRPRKGELPI
jgi:hypothetical protein